MADKQRLEGSPAPKRGKKSPESRYFDTLKGEEVVVVTKGGESSLTATLLWVDRYSLGVKLSDGREQMIFKHDIRSLGKA